MYILHRIFIKTANMCIKNECINVYLCGYRSDWNMAPQAKRPSHTHNNGMYSNNSDQRSYNQMHHQQQDVHLHYSHSIGAYHSNEDHRACQSHYAPPPPVIPPPPPSLTPTKSNSSPPSPFPYTDVVEPVKPAEPSPLSSNPDLNTGKESPMKLEVDSNPQLFLQNILEDVFGESCGVVSLTTNSTCSTSFTVQLSNRKPEYACMNTRLDRIRRKMMYNVSYSLRKICSNRRVSTTTITTVPIVPIIDILDSEMSPVTVTSCADTLRHDSHVNSSVNTSTESFDSHSSSIILMDKPMDVSDATTNATKVRQRSRFSTST